MSFTPPKGRLGVAALGLALVLSVLVARPAEAQRTGVLEGIVVEASTGRSLEGCEVRILGADLESRTGEDGIFRFPELPAGPVDVRVRLQGYVTFTDRFLVPEDRTFHLEVRLETVGAVLDEILVVSERRRPPPADMEFDLPPGTGPLSSNASVTVFRSSEVGGNSTFLIRGLKTMSGQNTPAVFVDGIRVFDFGPSSLSRTGGPSIVDLIPLETIDSVRVIRGPSAEAIRGGDTANGVILIFTKRGRGLGGSDGQP